MILIFLDVSEVFAAPVLWAEHGIGFVDEVCHIFFSPHLGQSLAAMFTSNRIVDVFTYHTEVSDNRLSLLVRDALDLPPDGCVRETFVHLEDRLRGKGIPTLTTNAWNLD